MKVRYEMRGKYCVGWQVDPEGEDLHENIRQHTGEWVDSKGNPLWHRLENGKFERVSGPLHDRSKKRGFFKKLFGIK